MLTAHIYLEGRTTTAIANTAITNTARTSGKVAGLPAPRQAHAQEPPTDRPAVELCEEAVLIRDLRIDAGAYVDGARDQEADGALRPYTVRCLDIGAQVLATAQRDHDTAALRSTLDDVERRVGDAAQRAADTVTQTVLRVVDAQDGNLARGVTSQVERLRGDLDRLVAHESSPVREAADRFLAGVGTELRRAAEADSAKLRMALSLDHPESPLTRLRAEFRAAADDSRRDVNAALAEVRTLLAVERATQHVAEQGSAKGLTYEEDVSSAVEQIAHGLGDLFDATGTQHGVIADCKTGDAVTTVAERTAPGRTVRLVVEAKDATMSAARWSAELDRARANRGAAAALGVVNGRRHMPGRRSLHVLDPLRIVVCHERGSSPDVLLAAYHLLRVQAVQATAADDMPGLDLAALQRQVDEMLAVLDGFDALDRAVSQTAKASSAAAAASEKLRRSLATQVARLGVLLHRTEVGAHGTQRAGDRDLPVATGTATATAT
jgi:hypothetical protein